MEIVVFGLVLIGFHGGLIFGHSELGVKYLSKIKSLLRIK